MMGAAGPPAPRPCAPICAGRPRPAMIRRIEDAAEEAPRGAAGA